MTDAVELLIPIHVPVLSDISRTTVNEANPASREEPLTNKKRRGHGDLS
jgi:hypothetical protein